MGAAGVADGEDGLAAGLGVGAGFVKTTMLTMSAVSATNIAAIAVPIAMPTALFRRGDAGVVGQFTVSS